PLPPHEWARDRTCEGRNEIEYLEHSVGGDWFALAFEREGLDGFDADAVAHQALRRRPDQDLAGSRSLLEPGSDVHCVPRHQRLTRPSDDLPRVDADPHLETKRRHSVAH